MQPGDTIQPTIRSRTSARPTPSQTVQVALVASTSPNFTVGSSIVALYSITSSIPSAAAVPTGGTFTAFNQTPSPRTTPSPSPGPRSPCRPARAKYFLGVVVDPYGKIQQLSTAGEPAGRHPHVGPPITHLPPAGVVSTANSNAFPFSPSGIFIGINPTTTTTSSTLG